MATLPGGNPYNKPTRVVGNPSYKPTKVAKPTTTGGWPYYPRAGTKAVTAMDVLKKKSDQMSSKGPLQGRGGSYLQGTTPSLQVSTGSTRNMQGTTPSLQSKTRRLQ